MTSRKICRRTSVAILVIAVTLSCRGRADAQSTFSATTAPLPDIANVVSTPVTSVPPSIAAVPSMTVVDVVGNLPASDYTQFIAGRAYKDWGNEPSVAVNPLDPSKIVISSFGFSTTSVTQPGASIWYSTNGGATWGVRTPITAPLAGTTIPRDWTFAYDSLGNLHAAVLGSVGGSTNIYHGMTSDPNKDNQNGRPAGDWSWTSGTVNHVGINNADQPWMALGGTGAGTHVYIGYDNFTNGVQERVARSDNNGATFTAANDLPISNGTVGSTTNPGTRVATDGNGNAYSIFGIGTSTVSTGLESVTYRLNSYHFPSSGGTWDSTTATAPPGGLLIDSGNSHQIDPTGATWFGGVNELRGNTTAIASDRSGSHIYTVYGKLDGNGVDRLYLAEFHPGVNGALIESTPVLFSVAGQRAALPAITVTDNGTVFIEYDSYIGPGNNPLALGGVFQVHLETSTDLGQTFSDSLLYSFTAPAGPNDPNYGGNREFGDYQYLTSLGNTAYGTFAARGDTINGVINTTDKIDPFFFTVNAVPEPSSLALAVVGGLTCLGGVLFRRYFPGGWARS